ncbi:MAG: YtfJ family protein [Vibrio fluvialis]
MNVKSLFLLLLSFSPTFAFSHNLNVGQTVPVVNIDAGGEMQIQGDDIIYQSWTTQQMLGKVRVIQAIAGRRQAKAMNAPLMSALTEAHFPPQQYQTTTIVNQDDAIWGTGTFVQSSAEESKKEFSWSSVILDVEGKLAAVWGLHPHSSAIIVQDKQGGVLFVKEGPLTQNEKNEVIALVKEHL